VSILNDKIDQRVAEALLEVQKHTAQVAAGLAQFNNGIRLEGARPRDASAHQRIWGGIGRLVGWSLYAKGGPVELLIRDARVSGTGDPLAGINLADGASSVHWLGPGGVGFGDGVYLDVQGADATSIAASFAKLRGTIWLGAVD
jgi:hypothetical protein